jgi:hypothetical protein
LRPGLAPQSPCCPGLLPKPHGTLCMYFSPRFTKITNALHNLSKASVINEDVLNTLLKVRTTV